MLYEDIQPYGKNVIRLQKGSCYHYMKYKDLYSWNSEEEQYIIDADEIVFIEAKDNKVYACTKLDTYEAKQKLYEIKELLGTRPFAQISKSVIVNINCVKSIQAEFSGNYRLKLKNRKESLTISRKYFKEFKDRI